MNCEDIQTRAVEYTGRKVDVALRREIMSHLEACENCRSDMRALSDTWQTLGDYPVIEPSANFRSSFWEKVRQEGLQEKTLWGWITWPRWTALTAGALAAWVVGLTSPVLLSHSNTLQEPLPQAIQILSAPYAVESIADIYFKGPSHE